ncbi:uncharacterized protein LOC131936093 [Physella acuta]|uniref:uncharacterized protein LOC131936093 n=1 Tax=Physella acuta TaxID=109671 RepID=UPI0027DDA759|nr:uncharacterized protein LOC131936093 [Physella acuta]
MSKALPLVESGLQTLEQSYESVRKFQRLTIVLSLILIVMCCIAISYGALLTNNIEQSKPLVCIECAKLRMFHRGNALIESLTLQHGENGVEQCCAHDYIQLSKFIEMNIQSRSEVSDVHDERPLSEFFFSPATAHRRVYPPAPNSEPTTGNVKATLLLLHQNSTPDPLVEHSRGVEVLSDGMKILHTGLYYIYSSLYFQPQSKLTCKEFKDKTWGHFVEKFKYNNPAKSGCLLKTSHTCCDDCRGDRETSFTSGLFNLEAGEIIRVVVTGYGLVNFNPQSSFVGVMMLGSMTSQGGSRIREKN